jgi:hypothetical protein
LVLDYFQTGAFLGTSKETTLRGVPGGNFVQDIKINDVTLRGSGTIQPLLTVGASSILALWSTCRSESG